MALTTRVQQPLVTRRSAVAVPAVRSRRATVVVKAVSLQELTDQVANAFVTIFSPPRDTLKNYQGTQNSFKGSSLHSQGRRPFKDGFDPKRSPVKGAKKAYVAAPPAAVKPQEPGYLEGAVGRVMAHQFKGDRTEPKRSGTIVEGWSGNTRTRSRDGFHSLSK